MKQFFTYVKTEFISCLKSKKSKFKGVSYAFTLAEVLITLGIIGVVAALTLPTLIQNHQKQTYVTGLKKAYSVLQNAFAQMALDEDVTDWSQTYCGSNRDRDDYDYRIECQNRIVRQFNVIDVKKYGDDCYFDWCSVFNRPNSSYNYSAFPEFMISDGMIYLVGCRGGDFSVDINGIKGPNEWGRDTFYFSVNYDKNKIVPGGLGNYQTLCTPENLKKHKSYGQSCTAKVLIEGKMDY